MDLVSLLDFFNDKTFHFKLILLILVAKAKSERYQRIFVFEKVEVSV